MTQHITRFELFRNAWDGLQAQGWRRAVNAYQASDTETIFACRYRTDDGLKCAFGHSIPDHLYSPELEGRSPLSVAEQIGRPILVQDTEFVSLLQRAHDMARTPEDVKRNLQAIAQMFQIDYLEK